MRYRIELLQCVVRSAINDQRVVLQTSPAFGFAFRLLLRVLRDVVLEFCRCLALSVIPHLAKFSPIPFSVSRTLEHCSAVSSPANSRRFRPPFFRFEVALQSFREALSIDISFGGCCWLERDREDASIISSAVRLLCSGFNQFSRALLMVIVAQNQDLSGCRDVLLAFLRTGTYCVAGSCVLVVPLDSSPDPTLSEILLDSILCFSNPRALFSREFSGEFPSLSATIFHVRGSVGLLSGSSSIDISFGGCCWLERDHEAASIIRSAVHLLCSGFNQFSRALLMVIVAHNQDLSGCRDVLLAFLRTGTYCVAGSCVLVVHIYSSPEICCERLAFNVRREGSVRVGRDLLRERSVQISPAFNVSDQTSPVCCAISDQRVVLQTSPAFGFAFRLLLRVLRDVVLEFCRCLALSVIPHLAKFSSIPFSVSRTLEHCSAVSSPANSRRFRPPFFRFEVALHSFREALSIDISFGGCCWLERDREDASIISSVVRLLCSGFNQFSRAFLMVIVAQNQDLSGCRDVLLAFPRTGTYFVAGSCVLVVPLDSSPGSSFRADLWSFAGSP
ncbi:hypothetical protein F511_38126 [Dorcoceras hygrometricum]|uniref:Uncharacterized protein n=1 Tax=Dorcoceras hygrometricum TaxID=472368 RepID=A0A2Z7C6E7_9LAMI|nr:hypothetical protein F511_38126 [Dorcoceras hygrometricum]